ncbi:hypothetical protein BT63DRAFT_479164 [Microthyrium microscopicum]|uniref:Ferric oxidoreductase domain-containing protein n=1 Tax=Microthyrium microscopicum TaxID=703497 RepID=A0A6A6UAN2_9PEZI|nr:hypothetical protein BT63DRAFT_479164 [Microthyrium microscopicum]
MYGPNLASWAFLLQFPAYVLGANNNHDVFQLKKVQFYPPCAHACRAALVDVRLSCSSTIPDRTTPTCYASNVPFLSTLGLCIHQYCLDLPLETINVFWKNYAVGWEMKQPEPFYSFEMALLNGTAASNPLQAGGLLLSTSVVSSSSYQLAYGHIQRWNSAEKSHAIYAIVVFAVGLLLPILLTLLKHILPNSLKSFLYARAIYPAWRYSWNVNFRETGNVRPTMGQAFIISFHVLFNIVLSIVDLHTDIHETWSWDDRNGKFVTALANRLGALALANFPLTILYSGRNNFLLALTNWSHSTYLMLHRWVGFIAALQAILHSLLFLILAVQEHRFALWSSAPAWMCGSVATICVVIMLPFAMSWFRQRRYELFLVTHIVLSIIVIVGTIFHIYHLFDTKLAGYILYGWIVVLLWVTERLCRLIRLFTYGLHSATIMPIDDDYIRVDIRGCAARGHVYLYFPTLTWRFWENHPFSVASEHLSLARTHKRGWSSTYSLRKHKHTSSLASRLSAESFVPISPLDSPKTVIISSAHASPPPATLTPMRINMRTSISQSVPMLPLSPTSPTFPSTPAWPNSPTSTTGLKSPYRTISFAPHTPTPGAEPASTTLSFFMRTHTGTTSLLRLRSRLPVLIEGSYGLPLDLSHYHRLICIAGGVGITAVISYLREHARTNGPGAAKLYWGSRSDALVDALAEEVSRYDGIAVTKERLDVKAIVRREVSGVPEGWRVAVVVSGPKAMADDVREVVCEVGRGRKGVVRLVDECFGW